jgi:hypothetical protein
MTKTPLTASELLLRCKEMITISQIEQDENIQELYQYIQDHAATMPHKVLYFHTLHLNIMVRFYLKYTPPSVQRVYPVNI